MPQMSQVLRECAIGMFTAGMSNRAVTRELNVHFITISRLQCRFREFGGRQWQWPPRPRVTTPAQTRPPHPASPTSRSSETSHPDSWCNSWFAQPKNFCTNCETVSGKLICVLVVLNKVLTWWQVVIVTDLSEQMLKCSPSVASGTLEKCSLHGRISVFTVSGRWQTACVGEQFVNANVVNRVGLWYGQA